MPRVVKSQWNATKINSTAHFSGHKMVLIISIYAFDLS
jgi:hypothetical protein